MEELEGVIVAGAGPVGLLTTIKLAQAGIPVTVLEQAPGIIESPRAIVYLPPMLEVLDKLGLLDDAKDVAVLLREFTWRALDGTVLSKVHLSAIDEDTAYPYVLNFGQDTLAEMIVKHLEPLPHVQVHWSNRVTELTQDESGVTVSVETLQETKQMRAPWLVGADGASSTIRKVLGLSFEGYTWPDMFVASNVYYDFEAYGYSALNFIVEPGYWAVIVKLSKEGIWRVAYPEDANTSQDEVEERLPEHFARILPGSGSYEVTKVSRYRAHQRAAERFRVSRVLLAGDAAHVTNPIGGLGLLTGVLDAEALADALTSVINGSATEGILDQYAEDRQNVFSNFTSVLATENKRRLGETDPARKARDMEFLWELSEDKEVQRGLLLYLDNIRSRDFAWAGR